MKYFWYRILKFLGHPKFQKPKLSKDAVFSFKRLGLNHEIIWPIPDETENESLWGRVTVLNQGKEITLGPTTIFKKKTEE